MMIQFPKGVSSTEHVWVNPPNVTHVEQLGAGERCKIHFVGGGSVDIPVGAATVVARITPHLK